MLNLNQLASMLFFVILLANTVSAQESAKDSSQRDSTKKATKELPLEPERRVSFSTREGTWISVDVSPDGQTIAFDLMGDIYTVPISGGKAKRLTEGLAYDVHPRYSPDGRSLLFVSDKSGNDNIWTLDMSTMQSKQVTKEERHNFFSAEWTADGEYIIGVKGKRNIKPHIYHKDGGSGSQLVSKPDDLKLTDPAVSPDGKLIYFSKRNRAWNYNAQLPQYQIETYDMEDGDQATITSRHGSAFTPTLSPDGQWLVYGSRYEEQTGLVLRNLKTGTEQWLAYPVQRDEQESIAPLGVLPAMSFTPDSKNLVVSYGGEIHSIDINTRKARTIPIEVDVELDMGPLLDFKYHISDDKQALATQIRSARPSPDGSKLAFTALNRLYVMDLPNGTPRRLTSGDAIEAFPAWSPDGKYLVFATWHKDQGHLHKVNVSGKARVIQLTREPALYSYPEWSYSGDRIVFHRGTAQEFTDLIGPSSGRLMEELAWISAEGGLVQVIDKSKGRQLPHFTRGEDRIYLTKGRELISIRWDGTDSKTHVSLKGITTFGSQDIFHDHFGGHSLLNEGDIQEETDRSSGPNEIRISPDGKSILAVINNDVYQATLPRFGSAPTISLAKAENAAFPAMKLTLMGGEFPAWSGDSRRVHWSLGSSHFVYDLEAGRKFNDSLAEAKKKEKELKTREQEKAKDSTRVKGAEGEKKAEPRYSAVEIKIPVSYDRYIPEGNLLLKGGRLITMNGKEVIENGDILIENNRIKAVGPTGTLDVPRKATVIDVSGKTLIPGFVDTHAHMWPAWGIHKEQVWPYMANLAYGVTTTRDPQTATTDVLTYGDMVEAGMIAGPRIYSTGPGLGYWMYNLTSLEHTKEVLKQYSDYYHTKTIKMYLVGNRQHRQWVIQACKELKLMPTTEGGLDFKLNMTQLLDGYPGHEHSFPIYPIYSDVITTVAESKMAVTPTLLVAYGGPWGENYYYSREDVWSDQKLQHFTPYEELAGKARRRPGWFMDEEHVFKKHAEFMKALVEAGGRAGVGSHGQLQGLGYHWELWSLASGGMDTHDALKVATLMGAQDIGLDGDLGSLEAGKLADIAILSANPLDNLRNTNTVTHVVKNGVVYEAATLDEIWPSEKKAEPFYWHGQKPEGLPGVRD